MKTQKRTIVFLAYFSGLVLIVSLLLAGAALASTAATSLNRFVIAGGGGQTQAGNYDLAGTIGQAVVGMQDNQQMELCSGFWCRQNRISIYLPVLLRND